VVDCAEAAAVLAEAERSGARLTAVLATHHHFDHVGGNADRLGALPGLRVYGSADDAPRIPGITHRVRDGDPVQVGSIRGQAIMIPAHTSGHLAYHFPSERAVFTGDTLFAAGCGRLFEGDAAQMMASLAKLAAVPDDSRVYCGPEYTEKNLSSAAMLEPGTGTLAAKVAARTDVRVVGVARAGGVFCAGLDLRELAAQREAGRVETHGLQETLELLERCPQPTIAAVQGDAIAGGCELALHCDLRVASERAHFAMPLARIGIAVPVTLTWKLVDTIGAAATRELLFTGEALGAQAALALGLVNRVVPPSSLDGTVAELAHQIAHNAPLSIR